MKTRLYLSLLFSLCYFFSYGQSGSYKITGTVTDTLNEPLIYATILLLEKQDSTMVDFARTEISGEFIFKGVAPGEYLVKTTYVGYIPLTVDASSLDGADIKLGQLQMEELAEELMTVVIKAAKAPIKMRGDTIEYDASTFKVPEGSTVEDLLKRLPGIEVEADGSILADGKDVNRVTVDGKSFFGSDPKAATKNLPAEGIGKVQVYDTKSEQEEITGATSESDEKTMNLVLKEEFKKGAFGKVIASVGSKDRRELKGNFNKFNKKIQFSIVGVGNNTGRNGLSWDDYQDFMGSQAWSFGGNTDYGFGGGNRYYFSSGGGNDLESSIRSVFFNGDGDSGFPENYNGGINFNYDHNKNEVSGVYYYNQAGLDSETQSTRQRFYEDFTTQEDYVSIGDDITFGHRAEVEFKKEIDSLNTVRFTLNGAQIKTNDILNQTTNLKEDDRLDNTAVVNNDIDTRGVHGNALLLYRKKFKKKGRSLGLNTSAIYTKVEDDWIQNSVTSFFNRSDPSIVDRQTTINQSNTNIRDKVQFKGNALYVEPLGKKFFWQTFYNHSNRQETGDRVVNDISQNEVVQNDSLSRIYDNAIVLNRLGTSLRYSHEGVNLTLGLGYQNFDLLGDFRGAGESNVMGVVDKQFTNWIPHFSLNFEPVSNGYADIGYSRNAQEPSIDDLQPIVNNLNPQYIRVGNIELTPEISNRFNARFNKSYPLTGVRLNFDASYSLFDNQFSTSEIVDSNFVTTVQPININGGNEFSFYTGVNFPIIKNKITTRMRMSYSDNNRVALVNGRENDTRTKSYRPYIRFNITPIDEIGIYLTARYSIIDTKYEIDATQNQTINTETYSVEFSAKTFAKLLFSANLDYRRFSNDRFDLQRDIPVLDLSLSRPVLKGNKGEVRLSLYDAFNQNVGFQSTDFFQSQSVNIGRYLLLSLTYNIRGVKSEAQQDSWW